MKYIIFLIMALHLYCAEFNIKPFKVKQGDFFTIWTGNTDIEIKKVKGDFFNTLVVPYISGNKLQMHIPIHYDNQKGMRDVIVDYRENGENKRKIFSIYIAETDFEKSKIYVDKEMKEKGTGENRAKSISSSQNARANPIKEPMWSEPFLYGTKGRITTGFGYSRYVNDMLTNRHSGLDIAAPRGTKVIASNKGKVVFSGFLTVTGNTIIIDHGGNIFTGYAHMKEREVEAGDMVERSQKIGEVGSTGFSTGPHLHFTLSVGTTFVNPDLLMDKEISKTLLSIKD